MAAKLQPVTAETLRACREDAPGAIRGYKRVVYALAAIIIPLSIYSFVCTALSNSASWSFHEVCHDASRIAFSQVMKNEKRECAVAFLKAAV